MDRIFSTYALVFLLALLMLPAITAADATPTFKQGEDINFSIPTYNSDNSPATVATRCNFTLMNPESAVIINNQAMGHSSSGFYSYWISSPLTANMSGMYPATVNCDNGVDYGYANFAIRITPTGSIQSSIFENPILLIFIALALILLVMGISFHIIPLGFLSGILFMLGGMYTMIYGFNNVTDLYTRGIAAVIITLGFVITTIAGVEGIGE